MNCARAVILRVMGRREELDYPGSHRVETMGGPMEVSGEEDPGISPMAC